MADPLENETTQYICTYFKSNSNLIFYTTVVRATIYFSSFFLS